MQKLCLSALLRFEIEPDHQAAEEEERMVRRFRNLMETLRVKSVSLVRKSVLLPARRRTSFFTFAVLTAVLYQASVRL